jgi:hypothetical protein
MKQGLEQPFQGLLACLLGLELAVHRLQDAGYFLLLGEGGRGGYLSEGNPTF